MTASKSTSQYNRFNWEDSDFPIVCETCLGDNPYMRMTKERHGKECGVCTRPFTVFRWQIGTEGKFRSTEICQVCTRTKHVCQSCISDLEYGLPVMVRDRLLNIDQQLPTGPVNMEYHQQLIERDLELSGDINRPYKDFITTGKLNDATIRILAKLAKSEDPATNKPNICTFYMKGECRRGEECPFRHEKPSDPDDPLVEQDVKDRYYGIEDSVAQRIIAKYEEMPRLVHPEDRSITTIEVYGLPETFTDADVRSYFYRFGDVRSTVSSEGNKWSIEFGAREAAEKAAQLIYDWNQLGHTVSVKWQQFRLGSTQIDEKSSPKKCTLPAVPGLPKPKLLPPLPQPKQKATKRCSEELLPGKEVLKHPKFSVLPEKYVQSTDDDSENIIEKGSIFYPSQDPERIGNKP